MRSLAAPTKVGEPIAHVLLLDAPEIHDLAGPTRRQDPGGKSRELPRPWRPGEERDDHDIFQHPP